MRKVKIKYNPYRITTQITVDGKKTKTNSALNVANFRLQEWIERLPGILIDEYRDRNFEIEFTGSEADYNDVVAAIKAYGDGINANCTLHKTPDIEKVEETINQIFAEIQAKEDVPELRTPAIIEAFEKAKNSRFEVNVVATMSSGKSTLINTLLGEQLMPAANEATTATIVKIVDTERDHFSAVAFDKSGNKVAEIDKVTLEGMKSLNSDERVSIVELKGKIPFVETTGMNLVLVDTPGPNNSRDKRHEEMTYGMIANSDKSLVLYVMNGTQLGINDEKEFLDFICRQMAEGGKQSRERFIFAVNKMDSYRPWPKYDGIGCISRALTDAQKGLESRGILNPNLFPVASLPALQIRESEADQEEDEDVPELDAFKKRSKKYEEMRFEQYYDYSNLPQGARSFIGNMLGGKETIIKNEEDEESESYIKASNAITEIHTGIVSIEQAISMYVNKYARTQKVRDLVDAFNGTLEEMATIASLQDEIAKDKKKAKELAQQIAKIQKNIESARSAKTLSNEIDKIDLTADVKREISSYMEDVRRQLSTMESGEDKVEKEKAEKMCKEIEDRCRALSSQIKVEIEKILDKAYKSTLTKIIDEYKKYLSELNLGLNAANLSFNPISLVSASLANLNQIIEDNTDEEDEGEYKNVTRRKEGNLFRKAGNFLTFGWIADHTYETKREWVSDWKEYVNMSSVSQEYLQPFRKNLNDTQKGALSYVQNETVRLKEHLKNELNKIDKVLDDKLNTLSQTQADSKVKADEIARNEAKLQWLKQIQQKVKNIIEF